MQWLENRLPPPLVMVAIAGWMAWLQWPQMVAATWWRWWLAGLLFTVAAVVVGLALRAFAQQQTTINPLAPERATRLVCGGVFAYSRNPMYLSMLLWLGALAVVGGMGWQWLGPVGFMLFINRFQIVPEERAMARLFADEFPRYRQKVPRWLGWRLNQKAAQA